jgi:hypothetical protein
LDQAVQDDEWCQDNGVTTGASYLLHWAASLIQQPWQKLPYLFFYGEQETGKSSYHNGLGLLMSRGHIEARNALMTPYNGELDGAILAYVEEVDLSTKGTDAYNRIKDWVTGDKVTINAKYANPYSSPSHLHWIQVANKRNYCPIFEDDSRIVVIHVAKKPSTDIPWEDFKKILRAEAPDFLRTLKDLRLPDGIKRLWLPVLETEAKREAMVESRRDGDSAKFDPTALVNALQLVCLREDTGVCRAMVSKLLEMLGDGQWSKDPAKFGKQLKATLADAHKHGLKATSKRVGSGVEWTIEEHWDETNIDPLQEWAAMSLLCDYVCKVPKEPHPPQTVLPLPPLLPIGSMGTLTS